MFPLDYRDNKYVNTVFDFHEKFDTVTLLFCFVYRCKECFKMKY